MNDMRVILVLAASLSVSGALRGAPSKERSSGFLKKAATLAMTFGLGTVTGAWIMYSYMAQHMPQDNGDGTQDRGPDMRGVTQESYRHEADTGGDENDGSQSPYHPRYNGFY